MQDPHPERRGHQGAAADGRLRRADAHDMIAVSEGRARIPPRTVLPVSNGGLLGRHAGLSGRAGVLRRQAAEPLSRQPGGGALVAPRPGAAVRAEARPAGRHARRRRADRDPHRGRQRPGHPAAGPRGRRRPRHPGRRRAGAQPPGGDAGGAADPTGAGMVADARPTRRRSPGAERRGTAWRSRSRATRPGAAVDGADLVCTVTGSPRADPARRLDRARRPSQRRRRQPHRRGRGRHRGGGQVALLRRLPRLGRATRRASAARARRRRGRARRTSRARSARWRTARCAGRLGARRHHPLQVAGRRRRGPGGRALSCCSGRRRKASGSWWSSS